MKSTERKLQEWGAKLTLGVSIPIVLFFIGLITFPFGIVFWMIGIAISLTVFTYNAKT